VIDKGWNQWFHQSGPTGRSDWTGPQTGSLGLDGLGLDRSIYTYNFVITFLAKYYRKHDSSSLFITTHPRIPTLIEIIPLLSVYSAPSRYIFPIKRLITGKVYPNPGHREGSVRTKPSPVCQHLGSVRSQSKKFLGLDLDWTGLDGSGLDWSIAGLVESLDEIAQKSGISSQVGWEVFKAGDEGQNPIDVGHWSYIRIQLRIRNHAHTS